MSDIKKITTALISMLIIIPLIGIGYVYFKLNTMYDKEEANKINTITQDSERKTSRETKENHHMEILR